MPNSLRMSGAMCLILAGVLAPVSFSGTGTPEAARAACPTCCDEPASLCYVCGTSSCAAITDAYLLDRSGPCSAAS